MLPINPGSESPAVENAEPLVIAPPGIGLALIGASELYLFVLIGACMATFDNSPLGHAALICFLFLLALVFFAVWWEHSGTWVICPSGVVYLARPGGYLLRGSGVMQFSVGSQLELRLSKGKKNRLVEVHLRMIVGGRRTRRMRYRRVIRQPLPKWMDRYYRAETSDN